MENLQRFVDGMGVWSLAPGQILMLVIASVLIYLAIRRGFEPLLLLPIGLGAFLANLPGTGLLAAPHGEEVGGLFYYVSQGIRLEIFPPLVFLGIGAMTDFGPLLANPKTFMLGAAAQFGVFAALFTAVLFGFSLQEAAAIGIIGGADGPTAIYLALKLSPHLLGPIAISAYSYMALVPVIQPPIMRWLTTDAERRVVMETPRPVSRKVRIIFPLAVTLIGILLVPPAAPLLAMLMGGNLLRESGVVERLSNMAQNELVNIVTFFLGACVGMTMSAEVFLRFDTLKILSLGIGAFALSTAGGLLFGKLLYRLTGGRVNPLIGAAGVSAVPMAARVAHNVGQEYNPQNYLLMHAMGPNVAGVLGTAIAAGVLLAIVG
jgi:sodium ion-translocating decarboxylase beta subunit